VLTVERANIELKILQWDKITPFGGPIQFVKGKNSI